MSGNVEAGSAAPAAGRRGRIRPSERPLVWLLPLALLLLSEEARKAAANGGRAALERELREWVDEVNAGLDPHEQLQFAVVVNQPWTTDNGLLTPTMKIKRSVIERRYEPHLPTWFDARKPVIWEDAER